MACRPRRTVKIVLANRILLCPREMRHGFSRPIIDSPLSFVNYRGSNLPPAKAATRLRVRWQITFRAFTKPRSRAKHGAGVSTPTEICYFHDLRGKRAKRALREMALLDEVRPTGCPTTMYQLVFMHEARC